MANKITNTDNYTNIANAIRTKNGSSDTYTPAQMPQAILDIPTGGGTSTFLDIAPYADFVYDSDDYGWFYVDDSDGAILDHLKNGGLLVYNGFNLPTDVRSNMIQYYFDLGSTAVDGKKEILKFIDSCSALTAQRVVSDTSTAEDFERYSNELTFRIMGAVDTYTSTSLTTLKYGTSEMTPDNGFFHKMSYKPA